jgi:hypothetical protein
MLRADAVAQVAPADLDVAVLGQLALPELALDNALEAGALPVIGFNAALRRRSLWEQALEHAAWHPDHAAVFADLHPELDGLQLGIPMCILRKGEEHRRSRSQPASEPMFSIRSEAELQRGTMGTFTDTLGLPPVSE